MLEKKHENDIFATLNADCMDSIISLHNIVGGEDLDAFESLSNMTCMTDFEDVIIGGCGPSLIYNVEISSEDSHVRLCRNDDEVLTVMKYCPETHYFYAGSDKGIMYCIPVIGKELKFDECKIKQVSNKGVSGIYFYDKKMISCCFDEIGLWEIRGSNALEKVVRIASDGNFNVLDLRIVEKGDETKIYFQKNHKLRSVDISDFVRTRVSDYSSQEPVRRELFSSPQIRQAVGKHSRNIDELRDTIAYSTPNTVIKNVSGLISDHKGLQSRHNRQS